MRAFASAFMLFCLTLIGIGGGPTIVGWLSDMFARSGEVMPLKSALEIMLVLNLLSVFALIMSSRTYEKDAARAASVN